MAVKLKDIVAELGTIPDGAFVWISRKTGETVFGTAEDLDTVEDDWDELDLDDFPEWQREALRTLRAAYESGDFVPLPSGFDIHEWEIMRDFCEGFAEGRQKAGLLRAIHGRGAFRHFKDTLHDFGLAEAWFEFRDQALEKIAIDFLDMHGIPWTR